jgi:hypothetical protein
MLDINGNVRDEARYAAELGREAEPVAYVGEWLAVPPVDIFNADGGAFVKKITVYETEEERRNRVVVEESPPRQQDNAEGQMLMTRLVGAMNSFKEKYTGLTWVEEDPNTNVIRRFWTVHDVLYAGWFNMDPRTTVEIKGRDEYFGIYRWTTHELRQRMLHLAGTDRIVVQRRGEGEDDNFVQEEYALANVVDHGVDDHQIVDHQMDEEARRQRQLRERRRNVRRRRR